jgi:RNA polymerase sigma-70 factor, ECF subfamily
VRSSLPLIEEPPTSAPDRPGGEVDAAEGETRRDRSGSVPSLREIFDEHAPFVWRTLRHLGVREADLPDVCQEVFVAVHRKLDGFEGRSSLRTWLYGICLRTASDHRRRAYVRRERAVAEPPPSTVEPTQDAETERAAARRLLHSLLDELDEDKRAVFVLYEIEELGMKEIAEILACPLQTAYSRLHAARKLVLESARRRLGQTEAT